MNECLLAGRIVAQEKEDCLWESLEPAETQNCAGCTCGRLTFPWPKKALRSRREALLACPVGTFFLWRISAREMLALTALIFALPLLIFLGFLIFLQQEALGLQVLFSFAALMVSLRGSAFYAQHYLERYARLEILGAEPCLAQSAVKG